MTTGNTKQELSGVSEVIDRRSFLRVASAAGMGLMLSPMVRGQGRSGSSNDLNVALLGSGEQGNILLQACLKIPGIRFKAVCDIWTEYNQKRAARLLKKYGHELNTYEDYREMLDKEQDLDVVLIATPDFWHAEHAVACLEAGLDVYCEKEMSNTLEGAQKMVKAARRTGKLLQIGHQRRSNPRYIHTYERIIKEARILGQITTINGQWNRAVQPDRGWPEKYAMSQDRLQKYGFKSMAQYRDWRWYKGLGGGPIVDLGSHQIDIYSWFLDANPVSVMASGSSGYYDSKTHEWHDSVLALFRYETPEGTVQASYQTITTNSSEGYFEKFMGDEGSLLISEAAGRAGIYREASAPLWDKWVKMGILQAPAEEEVETQASEVVLDVRETLAPPQHDLPVVFTGLYHQPHLENFFAAVRGKGTLNCPAEIGYETAVAVLKVNDAVEAARTLTYKPEEFHV